MLPREPPARLGVAGVVAMAGSAQAAPVSGVMLVHAEPPQLPLVAGVVIGVPGRGEALAHVLVLGAAAPRADTQRLG